MRSYAGVLIRRSLIFLGLMMVIATVTPIDRWYARALAGPWKDPEGDVLILLGADNPYDGYIGSATYWRSHYAVRAWQTGHFRTIMVCGGRGTAESMREYLVFNHIPENQIVLENRSDSTRENALFAAAILKNMPGRKVLLTSDFHMFRSLRAFRRAGVDAEPRPIPFALKLSGDWTMRWPVFVELTIETVKIAGYRWRGWI